MIDKKGIGVGQVFVFIVAALSFALILIFGYKAISGFLKSGEDVAFVQFKTGLESDIKKIYTEFGSVRVEKYAPPTTYNQICFVDLDQPYDPDLCNFDQVACSVWGGASNAGKGYEGADENVFLTPPAPVKIKVYRISMEDKSGKNFLCVPIQQGAFSIVMEGKGDKTLLSRVPAAAN
ncbi:MAG TPA: hypothetical protein VJB13_02460 [Candidatus Nanoarchaeia archaeon]|nr:hypothetical protein [Candidatus Nanoarchaeia archaeon]